MRKIFMILMMLVALFVSANERVFSFEQFEKYNTVIVKTPATISLVADSTYSVRMVDEQGCKFSLKNDTLFIESINQRWNMQEYDHQKTKLRLSHPKTDSLNIQLDRKDLKLTRNNKNKSGNQN